MTIHTHRPPPKKQKQIQALAAAVNCSGGNDDNKRRLGAQGACEEIVRAMQAFPQNPTVQLQGA